LQHSRRECAWKRIDRFRGGKGECIIKREPRTQVVRKPAEHMAVGCQSSRDEKMSFSCLLAFKALLRKVGTITEITSRKEIVQRETANTTLYRIFFLHLLFFI
jgi:hypothetical protein